jgi:hypothetical protein
MFHRTFGTSCIILSSAVQLAIASHNYSSDDYIYDYDLFKEVWKIDRRSF